MKPIIVPGSKILLVGEAPGAEEERAGLPFVGPSGKELTSILGDAGLRRADCSLTNVFEERPPDNDLQKWAMPRKDALALRRMDLPWSAIPAKKGLLPAEKVQPALVRLLSEIEIVRPNVIVTLGNTALAALTGASGITKLRGALHFDTLTGRSTKVIPTYHPAAVLRNYDWRTATVCDFIKAAREAQYPEARLLNRSLFLEPTLADLQDWAEVLCSAERLSLDIETKAKQITCIGFAPSIYEAYVVPFWTKSGHYWQTTEDEVQAYKIVKRICESRSVKVTQNGLYDYQYLFSYDIRTKAAIHDTMLLHHSLYPALPKGLDFLGSIYANERAWKRWRVRGGDTNEYKKEE